MPAPLQTGYFKNKFPYSIVRRKGTRDWLLTFTLGGHGFYRQEKVELEARPGDLILLEPGAYHHYGCFKDKGWEFIWAHFVAESDWVDLLHWPVMGKGLYRLHVESRISREAIRVAFFRAHREALAGRGALALRPNASSGLPRTGIERELAMNALEEVLLRAVREQERQAAGQGTTRAVSPEIRAVLEHLALNLDQPHRIEALAEIAKLSPSRFAHRFKEETGDAVIAFLLKMRLRQAARLIEFSGRSVKEAARETGFECPFYFSRQFRRHFSVSPREFKMRRMKSPASAGGRQPNHPRGPADG